MLAAALPLLALTARAAEAAAQVGPQELVTKVAQDTLRDLDAHRSEYKQNPKRVRELVDKNMLPHFDTADSAQLVLAKLMRRARFELMGDDEPHAMATLRPKRGVPVRIRLRQAATSAARSTASSTSLGAG
jgi:hypothetical protein